VSGRPIHAVAAIIATILVCGIGCARKSRAHVPSAPAPRNPPPAKIGETETGIASWYGHPYHGRRSASGEIYDMEQFTAAHRTLPFGTWLEVTNLQNRKIVDVRINDRGPFVDGRVIDLSLAAARTIDMVGPGVARVRLKVIAPPTSVAKNSAPPRSSPPPPPQIQTPPQIQIAPPKISAPQFYTVEAAAFPDRDLAETFQTNIRTQFDETRVLHDDSGWRVLVGRQLTLDDANRLAAKVLEVAGRAKVVADQ
jgi:rare lipoprotein A